MRCRCTGIAIWLVFVGCCGHGALATTRHHQSHMRGASLPTEELLFDPPVMIYQTSTQQGAADRSVPRAWANTTQEVPALRHQVVIAKYDEDVTWLHNLARNFDVSVYQSKDPSMPLFVENVGNEAAKYLSYIVENYDNLPETVAFMQAGRADWHDPLPKDTMMQNWDWGAAAEQGGIAFLPTAAPCLIEDSDPQPLQGADADATREWPFTEARQQEHAMEMKRQQDRRKSLVPDEELCPDIVEHTPPQMETVRAVWGEIFEPELGPLPKHWFTKCCAQFQVTRDAIHSHPLEFYQQLLQWTKEHDRALLQSEYAGEMRRNHDEARRDAGHVLEVLWALIFSSPMSRRVIS